MTLMGDRYQLQWCWHPVLSPQLLQQRPGLLEVSSVKALGEPAVDRRQERVGLGPLALVLPQAERGSW